MKKSLLSLIIPTICVATAAPLCSLTSCSKKHFSFFNNIHYIDFDEIQDLSHMHPTIKTRFRLQNPIIETHDLEVQVLWNETIFPPNWKNFVWAERLTPIDIKFNDAFRNLLDCNITANAVPPIEEVPIFYEGQKISFFVLLKEKDENGNIFATQKCKLEFIHRIKRG